MNLFGHNLQFWVTVFFAAAIKFLFSNYKTRRLAVASLLAAIFVPWLLTKPIIAYMEWNPETYLLPTAGLLAWMGEQLVKAVSSLDLDRVVAIWKDVRK